MLCRDEFFVYYFSSRVVKNDGLSEDRSVGYSTFAYDWSASTCMPREEFMHSGVNSLLE